MKTDGEEPKPTTSDACVDVDAALKLMGGDERLLREWFADCARDFDTMLKPIREAIEADDVLRLKTCAHKFKGLLVYIAANRASELARTLESMADEQKLDGALETYKALAIETERVLEFISDYTLS